MWFAGLSAVLLSYIVLFTSSQARAYGDETGGLGSTSFSEYNPSPTGQCRLINNLFMRVSEAGKKNEVIPFRKALKDSTCRFRIENADLMEKIKRAYLDQAANNVDGPQKVAGMFDCTARFFPDGSLAGPWVGSMGIASWDRVACEEKNMASQLRALSNKP